ncbi:MAG: DUF3800 domain-containing protein [Phycisphaerales bacterium]
MRTPSGTRHYYVDEAGDTTLFNGRGVVIVGKEGVSNTFIVGVLDLPDPAGAAARLNSLRRALLADPYFKSVPSMRPEGGKTAVCFHAKDDLPEVRREVFKLLPSLGASIHAAVRRKGAMIDEARMARKWGTTVRPGDVYDDLVKRLFKNLLHRGEAHEVCFARRGKGDRQEALGVAIERARQNFNRQWRIDTHLPCTIRSSVPSQDAGLQIVDYYLWALQRLFERGESRYFDLIAPQFKVVMDLDDQRLKPYGRWYTVADPLTIEKKKPLSS